MADEKKPDKTGSSNGGVTLTGYFLHPDPFVASVWGIVTLLLLVAIINRVTSFFSVGSLGDRWFKELLAILNSILSSSILAISLVIISAILIVAIIYFSRKLSALRVAEEKLMYPDVQMTPAYNNPKWQRILDHIESVNENDWRLAIIEADIILGGVLEEMSLPGETIGDKLKAIEKGDLTTLDNAWEAHKIRNEIAHEGSNFILNQREAKRAIDLYRSVFEEVKII